MHSIQIITSWMACTDLLLLARATGMSIVCMYLPRQPAPTIQQRLVANLHGVCTITGLLTSTDLVLLARATDMVSVCTVI